jgi:hypothetical protein
MFESNMRQLIEEFESRRELLIDCIGEKLVEILNVIKDGPISSHGSPPYLIADEEAALLWIDFDGRYVRLPPSFSIPSDIAEMNDGVIIYTLPVPDFGLIRFIPAIPSYRPDELDEEFSSFYGYTPDFLAGLAEYANILAQSIPKLASTTMAKSLLTSYPLMKRKADLENIEIKDFLSLKEVRDFYVSMLGDSLIVGAKKAAKLANESRAKKINDSQN